MTPLLSRLFERAGFKLTVDYGLPFVPQLSRKGGRDKSALPREYPGAKLARKAIMGRVAIKHLGTRADFQPSR